MNQNTLNTKPLPRLLKLASIFIGGGALIYFLIFLAAGTRISLQMGLKPGLALWMDGCLTLLFFSQHSIMVRHGFKKTALSSVPAHWIPAVFSIASGLTLSLMVGFWQGTGAPLIILPKGWLILMNALFILAIIGLKWGVNSLPGFDPLGIRAKKKLTKKPVLKFKGPYRYSRHPLYFFVLVLIWTSTEITYDRILFNLLWTTWIVTGTILEERDLIALFGKDYLLYQKTTPMLLPFSIFKRAR